MKNKQNSKVNISNISKIPDNDDNEEDDDMIDEDTAAMYETLFTQTFPKSATTRNIIKPMEKKVTLTTMKMKSQFSSAQKPQTTRKRMIPCLLKIKPPNSILVKSQSSQAGLILNRLTFTPVKSFLSNEDMYKFSDAQTEYMRELDALYRNKIQKINEVHKKYDNELFRLREGVDEKNKENIINIIYDSLLKDKKEEMKEIEDEFLNKKSHAIFLYKNRSNKLKEMFCGEIAACINNINSELNEKMLKYK